MRPYRPSIAILPLLFPLVACGGGTPADQAVPSDERTLATGADQTLPEVVTSALSEYETLCREVGGTPRSDDAVRRADLNADDHPDFVFFAGWIQCENAASIFGDREKALVVFAADANGGAVSAFTSPVFDARIEVVDERASLWLTTSGGQCGAPRAPSFAEETFCDRPIVAAGPARFEYAPVERARIIR